VSRQVDRRRFLTRAAAGAGAIAGAGALSGHAVADAQSGGALSNDQPVSTGLVADPAAAMAAVPFHGAHQAGITTVRQPAGTWASFNVIGTSRGELIQLLQTLTKKARFLTAGGSAASPPGALAPPIDSGTLGTTVPADGLTITLALGSSLFDDRFAIADRKPKQLRPMESFPNDDLNPALCGGDLLLQICAGSQDTVLHALRQIARETRGAMQPNWRYDGFVPPPRPSGVPRNHFAFKDGIANPDVSNPTVANELLWVVNGIGEPAWATGGSYHVVRIVKQLVEFWDRVSISEQEQMIGRSRPSGAPLDGTKETDIPNYAADPQGRVIPLSAHIRLSNPRTTATENSRIYRRGYNYDQGIALNGNLNMGLIFNAFQQDLDRQFIATQTRLIGEPMVDYISPIGGGYFFALPGVHDKNDWFASRLFD
jgi:deferrochelatase/peroxidase EfeB